MGKEDKIYLTEMIERERVDFGKINMILSPVGSGKTHFIFKKLFQQYEGKKLMLVSTSSLKHSVLQSKLAYSTKDLKKKKESFLKENNYIHVMTYSEFSRLAAWNFSYFNSFEVIFCDEIHSLFEYFSFSQSLDLGLLIRSLFEEKADGPDIFHFTATTGEMSDFIEKYKKGGVDLFSRVKKVNYLSSKDIMCYKNDAKIKFTRQDEILLIANRLREKREDAKGLIFNDRIKGMKRTKELLELRGYKVATIWSIHNQKEKMNEEELRVREYLLEEGKIPDEYDFIIINGAMREGWSLHDNRVEIVILNTMNETNRIQARGRVRGDVRILATLIDGQDLTVVEKVRMKNEIANSMSNWLGLELTTKEKNQLINEFNIRNDDNKLYKWPTISKSLKEIGYNIYEGNKRIAGKVTRYSIITKSEERK